MSQSVERRELPDFRHFRQRSGPLPHVVHTQHVGRRERIETAQVHGLVTQADVQSRGDGRVDVRRGRDGIELVTRFRRVGHVVFQRSVVIVATTPIEKRSESERRTVASIAATVVLSRISSRGSSTCRSRQSRVCSTSRTSPGSGAAAARGTRSTWVWPMPCPRAQDRRSRAPLEAAARAGASEPASSGSWITSSPPAAAACYGRDRRNWRCGRGRWFRARCVAARRRTAGFGLRGVGQWVGLVAAGCGGAWRGLLCRVVFAAMALLRTAPALPTKAART